MTLISPAYKLCQPPHSITIQGVAFNAWMIGPKRHAYISADGLMMVKQVMPDRWEASRYSTISKSRIKLSRRFLSRDKAIEAIIRTSFGASTS